MQHLGNETGIKEECPISIIAAIEAGPGLHGCALVQYRIVKAKELLEAGNISTTEACLESGFRDYSHFIRTFKELAGLPPAKYAKQVAAGKWQGLGQPSRDGRPG
ncbi:DNA-binding transcriptional regulator ChbR [compost metagenome]